MSATPRKLPRWEDAAEYRTQVVTGWFCKACGRAFGQGKRAEHMARHCHGSADQPCRKPGCPNRTGSAYMHCDACRALARADRWYGLARHDWDGLSPLGVWDDDKYFFDPGDVFDYVQECLDAGDELDNVRLVLLDPDMGPHFDVTEFLGDHLPDDDHGGHNLPKADVEAINLAVNAWVAAHAPLSWSATSKAVSTTSLCHHLGLGRDGRPAPAADTHEVLVRRGGEWVPVFRFTAPPDRPDEAVGYAQALYPHDRVKAVPITGGDTRDDA